MVEFADFNHGPMETPMTEPTLPLIELLQKQDNGDFLRAVAEAVLQLLVEHEVEGVVGAGRYERGDGRQTWRNGYRVRELRTRFGALNLRVPRLRQGSYFPGLPGAAPDVGVGAGRSELGGLDRRRLDAPGRRHCAGHGADRHLQEHRVERGADLRAGRTSGPARWPPGSNARRSGSGRGERRYGSACSCRAYHAVAPLRRFAPRSLLVFRISNS